MSANSENVRVKKMTNKTQLEMSRELVQVLEQLAALDTRREQLIAALAGKAVADDKPTTLSSTLSATDALFDMPRDTPEQKAAMIAASEDVYNANVDPASPAQKKMIFGILGKQFGIKDDDSVKLVIKEILKEQHDGYTIESISKELSKAWAGGLIDYLTTAPTEDVLKHLKEPF